MPLPSTRIVDVAGIPALVAPVEGVFIGTLTFGVGRRDETARSSGVAHLIEHLVMSRVGRIDVSHNARTADEDVSFYAHGDAAAVADFLNQVAAAINTLHEITDEDVAVQRLIITNELGAEDERPGRGALVDRFGNQSIGLLTMGSPAHRSHTRDDALQFADTWLHAGNAVMSFTGEIPANLAVTLPQARPLPERIEPKLVRGGQWVFNGNIPLTITMVMPTANFGAYQLAARILSDQLHKQLREQQSLIYSVQPATFKLNNESSLVFCALDPRPETALRAGAEALKVIRDLAENGPTEDQLAQMVDQWAHAEDHPALHYEYLDAKAISLARGRISADQINEFPDLAAVTVADVQQVLKAGLPDAFVTLGEDVHAESVEHVNEALGLPPAGDPDAYFAGLSRKELLRVLKKPDIETYSGVKAHGTKGWFLAIDDERISWVAPTGDVSEVRFDQIVLALYSVRNRAWLFFWATGTISFIDRDQWREDPKLHATIKSRIPDNLQAFIDVDEASTA
jgi:hypothetical protein